MPPTVPNYDQAYGSLANVYDPQTSLINQQISSLQPQEDAALASLDQAKVNAFKDITNQSNSRGVLFSGVPIDEQATYVGTKYLPAVANTKTSFKNQQFSLVDKINQINAARANQAQGLVSDAQKNYDDYTYKQQQLALSAQKSRASSSKTSKPTATQTKQADVGALYGQLQKLAGRDGYIAPDAYAEGLKVWQSAGYSHKEYDQYFSGLRNPNNTHYRLSTGWGS